jgi:hypothetical protein
MTSDPDEICPPCGIPGRGFRLTTEIPQGKQITKRVDGFISGLRYWRK